MIKNRNGKILIITLCLIISQMFGVTAYATQQSHNYSADEIKQRTQQKLNAELNDNLKQKKLSLVSALGSDSFSKVTFKGFELQSDVVDHYAFEIGAAVFNGKNLNPNDEGIYMPYTYSGGSDVSFTHTSLVEVSTSDLWDKLYPKIKGSYSVSQESRISSSVTSTQYYWIPKDTTPIARVYAWGVKVEGYAVFYGEDKYGNSGTFKKQVYSSVPYAKYTNAYISFGELEF